MVIDMVDGKLRRLVAFLEFGGVAFMVMVVFVKSE